MKGKCNYCLKKKCTLMFLVKLVLKSVGYTLIQYIRPLRRHLKLITDNRPGPRVCYSKILQAVTGTHIPRRSRFWKPWVKTTLFLPYSASLRAESVCVGVCVCVYYSDRVSLLARVHIACANLPLVFAVVGL